jgi:hypothetical protein
MHGTASQKAGGSEARQTVLVEPAMSSNTSGAGKTVPTARDVQSRTAFNARDTLRGAYDDTTVFQAAGGQR